MKNQAFNYTAAIKIFLSNGKVAAFQEEHPGVTDIAIASRPFSDYNECIMSCKQLMTDIRDKVNSVSDEKIYKLSSEINPVHSGGAAALSRDWSDGEVCRLWIFDEAMEGKGAISAIGQARIFAVDSGTRHLSLN